jgi:glutamyl/glutaminyl-tRNA synthetase
LPQKAAALWSCDPAEARRDPENAALLDSNAGRQVIAALRKSIETSAGAITAESFKSMVNQVKAETGVKGRELFHPIRIALTGAHSGPEFDKLIPLIEDGSSLRLPTHVRSVRERLEMAWTAPRAASSAGAT